MSQAVGFHLSELVASLGGEWRGEDVRITAVAPLETAGAGDIAFLANPKYRQQLATCRASAVIVRAELAEQVPTNAIVAADPYLYFAKVARLLHPHPRYTPTIHPSAVIGEHSEIAPTAHIAAQVVIGAGVKIADQVVIHAGCVVGDGVEIGAGTVLHPRVTVYRDCLIGARCVIHSGAVIGADGFGMAWAGAEEGWFDIPQIGRVVIEDNVHVGANTTIDRGALADTVIEYGARLDNQIQIAHNVRVGKYTAMAACVGVAGSTRIGAYCMVGGAGMISGHLQIGDRVHISGGTLVAKSIREPGHYTAVYPLATHREWTHNAAQLRQLDRLYQRVKTLEAQQAASETHS